VLVVSCPCALSLATPAALTVATGALAARGVLVTRGHAIEALARADRFVFDKTGTLDRRTHELVETLPVRGDADVRAGDRGGARARLGTSDRAGAGGGRPGRIRGFWHARHHRGRCRRESIDGRTGAWAPGVRR
jgi:hypothetical protein